ncbi:MAG: ABC transporter substrate-binding protein, partial [Pseudolysinimonas sp.]
LTLVKSPPLSSNLFFFNTAKAPFNDIRARQAVAYAIDQNALSKALFYGFAKPTQSMIGSGSFAYPGATVQGYPSYNLSKAKSLVAELGGLSFSIETSNTPDFIQQMTAVQTMLAAAGITMEINGVEPSKKIGDFFSKNFSALQFVLPVLPDPNSLITQFFTGPNPTGLQDPTLSALLTQGNAVKGDAARKAVYLKVVERMAELMPVVFLADTAAIRLENQRIHGVVYTRCDFFYLDSAWVSGK